MLSNLVASLVIASTVFSVSCANQSPSSEARSSSTSSTHSEAQSGVSAETLANLVQIRANSASAVDERSFAQYVSMALAVLREDSFARTKSERDGVSLEDVANAVVTSTSSVEDVLASYLSAMPGQVSASTLQNLRQLRAHAASTESELTREQYVSMALAALRDDANARRWEELGVGLPALASDVVRTELDIEFLLGSYLR